METVSSCSFLRQQVEVVLDTQPGWNSGELTLTISVYLLHQRCRTGLEKTSVSVVLAQCFWCWRARVLLLEGSLEVQRELTTPCGALSTSELDKHATSSPLKAKSPK